MILTMQPHRYLFLTTLSFGQELSSHNFLRDSETLKKMVDSSSMPRKAEWMITVAAHYS